MSEEQQQFFIGLQQVFVICPDGVERQLTAAQDCMITGKISQNIMKGDNARTALSVINASKDLKISGKNAKVNMTLLNFLMGGTKTQVAANSYNGPNAMSGDCSMKNAISVSGTNGDPKVTDMFLFYATGTNTFTVTRMSDGSSVQGHTASYPQNQLVPGLTIVVNGTLGIGAVANIKTAALGETVETRTEDANDVPVTLAVRVVTEPSDDGQFGAFFFACKPSGLDLALKTVDHGELSFEFTPFEEPTLHKIAEWTSLSSPPSNSC